MVVVVFTCGDVIAWTTVDAGSDTESILCESRVRESPECIY